MSTLVRLVLAGGMFFLVVKANAFDPSDSAIRHWMLLMQYRSVGKGYKSKIINQSFFIHADGATNPEVELSATLDLFQKELPMNESHPQCVFPARYRVLRESFPLAKAVPCQSYDKWKAEYQPTSVSLFYASQYLSNPASVFGHAFFLINSASIERYSQMTFNFAADIPAGINGFLYAYKGLTGGFSGVFSLEPFYERLHIYTNMEDRDLWEYELSLNREQRELFYSYLWELRANGEFAYYFLDQNCGSILLWLLNAIVPETSIKTTERIYIQPSEAVRVAYEAGLVSKIIFHPSLTHRLLVRHKQMSQPQRRLYLESRNQRQIPKDLRDPLVLEALLDHMDLEFHRHSGKTPDDLKDFERSVLLQRSELQGIRSLAFPEIEKPLRPHLAHRPMMWSLGVLRTDQTSSALFSFRPAIHGLLDPEPGFLKNSAIEILSMDLRAENKGPVIIHDLTLIRFLNLNPINDEYKPISFGFHAHVHENPFLNTRDVGTEITGELGIGTELSSGFSSYLLMEENFRLNQTDPMGHFDVGLCLQLVYSEGKFKAIYKASVLSESHEARADNFFRSAFESRYSINADWFIRAEFTSLQSTNNQLQTQEGRLQMGSYF